MTDTLNRRIHPRSLTDERAEIAIFDHRLACVVRDRSHGGARLVFRRSGPALPSRFALVTNLGERAVELVWFDGLQAGVRFL